MGFIRMSNSMVTTVTQRFLNFGDQDPGNPVAASTAAAYRGLLALHAVNGSFNEYGGRLAIMKGTVPTDFSTLVSYNSQSSNVLVVFDSSPITGGGINNFIGTQSAVNPMVITTVYVNAIAAGTATWFWWFTSQASGAGIGSWINSDLPANQIVGTVGITGSGADLTIPSTTVSIGTPLRIVNYRLQIPSEWTF